MFLDKSDPKASEWLETANSTGTFVLIDKDKGWTSFDVVAKLRRITKIKKIGHAGTLDPFATGLLIVAVGRGATKQIDNFQNMEKRYTGIIRLGAITETYDSEAEEMNQKKTEHITLEMINDVRKGFIGIQMQRPPIYSAKKIKGKALYKYARKNQEVEIPLCEIEVKSFNISKVELPEIHFDINVSKGTYIRSIANDFGEKLGCGAYLNSLRRESIGEFNVDNSFSIKEIEELFVQTISKTD